LGWMRRRGGGALPLLSGVEAPVQAGQSATTTQAPRKARRRRPAMPRGGMCS